MNSGRAKKIRQMIGYDVGADNIMGRQYQWNSQEKTKGMKTFKVRTNIVCVGIRRSYRHRGGSDDSKLSVRRQNS